MEITLAIQTGTQVNVSCDGQPSHTFDLLSLLPQQEEPEKPQVVEDPQKFGEGVYTALFPPVR